MNYSTTSDENVINIPSERILRNYPNPFNPTTTIEFSLNESDINKPVLLEIYNLKGQKIREFQLSNSKLGINSIVWNGKSENGKTVGSGIYLYKFAGQELWTPWHSLAGPEITEAKGHYGGHGAS